ncbi:hypothetical protein F5Y17DRAFT_456988 [Xylariaceae sp. FL0594]|nr:hypothetical protein F5Y17DRAFT_456988 [Xylariaceae sp. FL0594]
MCRLYRECFTCDHTGRSLVEGHCAARKGVDCPHRKEGAARSRSGKCGACRRYDEQIRRDTEEALISSLA